MILAVSDSVWLALVGVLMLTVKEYFDAQRANRVAVKVAEVAVKADIAATKVDRVSEQVEQVHIATNSMKDQLVSEVRKASFAEGVKSEKDNPSEGKGAS
jgi:hypothetical protein